MNGMEHIWSKYEVEIENFRKAFFENRNERIAIYGIGRRTATLLPGINDFHIIGLLDRDQSSIGKKLCGIPVISLEKIEEKADIIVINSDPSNYEIIYKRISNVKIPVYYANGQEAKIIVKESNSKENEYWKRSYEELKRNIEKADIVSFDLFDTLIMRKIFSPEDVYKLLERKAKEIFGLESDIASERVRATSQCNANATLSDIYDVMQQKLSLTEEQKQDLMELEENIDLELCIPRDKLKEALEYAVSLKKEVYILSDMYYAMPDIKRILKKCGMDIIDENHIWISCEKKIDKITGSMWKHFSEDIVKEKNCLHIGDNQKSDVTNPQMYGIATYYIMSGKDMLLASTASEMIVEISGINESVSMGLWVSRELNDPFALSKTKGKITFTEPETYGYCIYGPIITKFLIWLYHTSHRDAVDKLLFFARDGYFLIKDYQEMIKELEKALGIVEPQRLQYLQISRRVIYIAAIENADDFKRVLEFPYVGTFAEYMLSRFNIKVSDKTAGYNDQQVNAVGDGEKILRWIEPYQSDIQNEIDWEKQNYRKYLASIGLTDSTEKLGTVDLGYYGTNQFYLQKILDRRMQGYCFYACLSDDNVFVKDISMKGCFQSEEDLDASKSYIKKKNMYVETFLTAPYGMIRYLDDDMSMVCEPDRASQKNFKIKEQVNEGVLDYMRDYLSLSGSKILGADSLFQEKLFYHMLDGMAGVSKDILEGFYFDNDFVGGREMRLEI